MSQLSLTVRLAVSALSDRGMLPALREANTADDARGIRAPLRRLARQQLGRRPPHQLDGHIALLWSGRAGLPHVPTGQAPRDASNPPVLMTLLAYLSRRFLQWRRGGIELRYGPLLELQQIARQIHVEHLVAFTHAVHCLDADGEGLSPRALSHEDRVAYLRGPLLPPPSDVHAAWVVNEGLAEVHRHHNGSMMPFLLWRGLLDRPVELAVQLRKLKGADDGDDIALLLRDAGILRRALRAAMSGKARSSEMGDVDQALRRLITGFGSGWMTASGLAAAPTASSASDEPPLFQERRFLLEAFNWLAGMPSDATRGVFARALHLYLLAQNLILGRLSQPFAETEGLQRFTEQFSGSAERELAEQDYVDRLVQASRTGRVTWLETRLSPSGDVVGKVQRLLDGARRRRRHASGHARTAPGAPADAESELLDLRRPRPDLDLPAVGVVFHFIRRDEKALAPLEFESDDDDRWLAAPRHAALRRTLWEQGYALRRLSETPEGAYLVGLDVAGSERDTPVEVFAPVIRWLRAPFGRRADRTVVDAGSPLLAGRTRALGVTAHAGEDFHHLLSGMRGVDESVRFLDLRAGDRLGHALALGLEPSRWAERCGRMVTMEAGEWLDTLVWFHDRLVRDPSSDAIARQVRIEAEKSMRRIYGREVSGQTVDLDALHRAWYWRSVDAELSRSTTGELKPSLMVGDDDRGRFIERCFARCLGRYGQDALELHWRYHQDIDIRRRRRLWIEVELPTNWDDAIRRVQDQMVGELARRRIAIEINPSSNVTIGPIDSLTEHPVFRWLPPDAIDEADRPFIVVGSDDPGIFATELVHEYVYLARAAEHRGATPRQIAAWLSDLQRTSRAFSFLDTSDPAAPHPVPWYASTAGP